MCSSPRMLLNLLIAASTFMICSFSFYLLGFYMKYLGGNIFINNILAALSQVLASIISIPIHRSLGTKYSYSVFFILAFLFGLPLYVWNGNGLVVAICIFPCRFGIFSAYSMTYYLNQEIFPIRYVSIAFGISNICARVATIVAPQVAELGEHVPIVSLLSLIAVAFFLT